MPATPQVEYSNFRSRGFAFKGKDGETAQRAKRDRTGSNFEMGQIQKPGLRGTVNSQDAELTLSAEPGEGPAAPPRPL